MEEQLKSQMLDMLLGELTTQTKKFAEEEIDKIKAKVNDDLLEMKSDAEKLKKELDVILEDCPTVVNLGTVEKPAKELTHTAFDKITKILSSAKRKEKNIMLVGGAGGGKTHLVSQIAKALKLPFYPMSVGMQTTKSDLLGFINATGAYVPSCIRKAYEDGGVLLLDEFDAAHAGVVTILNSLLANGHCSFPDKIINKHKDFICICACNTYGNGANLDYIGRNRLDGATLDRFIIVDVDYDEKLEKKLTNNKGWYSIVKKIRKNAEKNGIKIIISPRACMDGADLLDAGFKLNEVIDMTILKGNSEDIRKKLMAGIKESDYKKDEEVSFDDSDEVVDSGEYDFDFVLDENDMTCYSIKQMDGEYSLKAYPTENRIEFKSHFANSGENQEVASKNKCLQFKTVGNSNIGIYGTTYQDMMDTFEKLKGYTFSREGGFSGNVRFVCQKKSGKKITYIVGDNGKISKVEE